MGYRICLANGTDEDVFTEPKGWDRCPCDVPKCPKRPKCEKDSVMCRAFEIWTINGSRLLPTGTHMMGFEDCLYPSRSSARNSMNFKKHKTKKHFDTKFIRKIESMWADGKQSREIAQELNSTFGYIEHLIRRFRNDPNYLFESRTPFGRKKDDKRRLNNEVPTRNAPDNRCEIRPEEVREDGLVQEAQVYETAGDRLQGMVSRRTKEGLEDVPSEGDKRSGLVYLKLRVGE